MTYSLILPRRVLFGVGQLKHLGELVDSLGAHRALLVHGPNTAAAGIVASVEDVLGKRLAVTFSSSHSPTDDETCEAVGALADGSDVDIVISVGGGSAIDAAKCAVDRIGRSIPLLAIPTTFSGAELTLDCGIVNTVTKVKRVIRGPHLVATSAVYDPTLLGTLPDSTIAGSAMNSLAHCVEALYTPASNRFIQSIAIGAARQLVDGLRKHFIHRERDISVAMLLDGSFGAGVAQGNAGIALHHAICHYLGPQLGIPHGTANSIMLPHVMRFNLSAAETQFAELAQGLGEGTRADSAITAIEKLRSSIGLPNRLGELGLTDKIAHSIAHQVIGSVQIKNNPRQVREEDVVGILAAAT